MAQLVRTGVVTPTSAEMAADFVCRLQADARLSADFPIEALQAHLQQAQRQIARMAM